jgi:hypothetical protein
MKTKEQKEYRKKALDWWFKLNWESKFFKVEEWLSWNNKDTTSVHPNSINYSQIQEVYKHHHS